MATMMTTAKMMLIRGPLLAISSISLPNKCQSRCSDPDFVTGIGPTQLVRSKPCNHRQRPSERASRVATTAWPPVRSSSQSEHPANEGRKDFGGNETKQQEQGRNVHRAALFICRRAVLEDAAERSVWLKADEKDGRFIAALEPNSLSDAECDRQDEAGNSDRSCSVVNAEAKRLEVITRNLILSHGKATLNRSERREQQTISFSLYGPPGTVPFKPRKNTSHRRRRRATIPSSCRRSVRYRPPRRRGYGERRRRDDSAVHRAYKASVEHCRY